MSELNESEYRLLCDIESGRLSEEDVYLNDEYFKMYKRNRREIIDESFLKINQQRQSYLRKQAIERMIDEIMAGRLNVEQILLDAGYCSFYAKNYYAIAPAIEIYHERQEALKAQAMKNNTSRNTDHRA